MEEHPTELQEESATEFNDGVQEVNVPVGSCHREARNSCSPHAEIATSSNTITDLSGNITMESSSTNVATSTQKLYLSECKDLVPSPQPSKPASVNLSANKDAVDNIGSSVVSVDSQISNETMHQECGDSHSGEISIENHASAFVAVQSPVSSHVAEVSNSPVTSQLLEDEPGRPTLPSGLGFLVSNLETGQGSESVPRVNVVTISSNILSDSNAGGDNDHDARRTGRRLFWNAFSRRNSRRRFGHSPTIFFSSGDADNPGPQDRWLVDLDSDFSNGRFGGDSGYMGTRIHRLNEQRQHPSSEMWERFRGGLDEIGRWNSSCPLGLHADGMCSCESSPLDEESSTRARIARIVMLAEALFEILDEIHQQPLSFSVSMALLPAPESIVDSFPLKSHKKVNADGSSDTEQCYICLAEYEEGDQIRVLPCNHEYHMSCIDKWLKEIHGVCPLCRGNVCGGFTESSAPNTEVPSH